MSGQKTSNAAVIRVHKNKNYTVMSNNHLFDKPPLSLKAKGLMSLFLALPDDWNYSINGLVKLCKESRDCIKVTLNELKSFGYLKIEKRMPNETKSGRIEYIYHIFEEKQEGENPPLEFKKQEAEKQALEIQALEKQEVEKPIQLNTNKLNTKKRNTNKETLVKTSSIFTPECLFNLYKKICLSFPQPRELSNSRIQKAKNRIKNRPSAEFWETVFKKAEASDFCKKASWFSFDWILKNDENALKVFEGNYDNKNSSNDKQKTSSIQEIELMQEAKKITSQEEAINFVYKNISDKLKSTYTSGYKINLSSYDWIVFLGEKFQFNRQVIYDRLYEELDGEDT